jgi:hypothetical protein
MVGEHHRFAPGPPAHALDWTAGSWFLKAFAGSERDQRVAEFTVEHFKRCLSEATLRTKLSCDVCGRPPDYLRSPRNSPLVNSTGEFAAPSAPRAPAAFDSRAARANSFCLRLLD